MVNEQEREAERQRIARERNMEMSQYILAEIDRANQGWKPGYPVSLWRTKK